MWTTNRRGRKINYETREMECSSCRDLLPFAAFYTEGEDSGDIIIKHAKCKKCKAKEEKIPKISKLIDGVVMYGYADSKKPFYNDDLEIKECRGCGHALHKNYFRPDATGVYGVYSRCKTCMTESGRIECTKQRKSPEGRKRVLKSAFILTFNKLFPEIEEVPEIEEKTLALFVILAHAEIEVAVALRDPKNKESKMLTYKMFSKVHGRSFNHYTKRHEKK